MEQEPTPPVMKSARRTPPPSPLAQAQAGGASAAEDRLSALDDGTLHAILALLPLRDAAATSVLSRRWPRVFATLPRLVLQPNTFNRRDFDDGGDEDYCEDAHRWMHSLACVLESRATPIAAFEIHFKYMGLYDRWFDDLFRELCASGGLLELSIINTKYSECYPLPAAVYNCGTLTTLDLFNWRLKVPGRMTGLRALRLLRLRNVVASDDDLRRIITRCSAMEHLETDDVHKARNIVITRAPRLEKLEIFAHRPLCISVKKAPRLDSVRLSLSYSHPDISWSIYDSKDSDEDYSFAEIEEMYDYKKMAEREHQLTDEVGNMVTFLSVLGRAKKLDMYLPTEFSQVLSMANVSMPKRLAKKSYLLGLETLTLTLDHNHEALATLVSCLLNSSPNLKDLRIMGSRLQSSPVSLAAEFWEKLINADCVLNHLSSFTFFIEPPFEGHPCKGLCQFLLMNARVLKRLRIEYRPWLVKPEHAAKLEAVRNELNLWPRASPDMLVELCPFRYPSY